MQQLPPIICTKLESGILYTSAGIALKRIDADPAFMLAHTPDERERQFMAGEIHYYNIYPELENTVRRILRSKGELLPQDDPRAKSPRNA